MAKDVFYRKKVYGLKKLEKHFKKNLTLKDIILKLIVSDIVCYGSYNGLTRASK